MQARLLTPLWQWLHSCIGHGHGRAKLHPPQMHRPRAWQSQVGLCTFGLRCWSIAAPAALVTCFGKRSPSPAPRNDPMSHSHPVTTSRPTRSHHTTSPPLPRHHPATSASGSSPHVSVTPGDRASPVGRLAMPAIIRGKFVPTGTGTPLEALAYGDRELLFRPCVDCGQKTGRCCDYCYAVNRIPTEQWAKNQLTPLCSICDNSRDMCHFCLGVHSCRPHAWSAVVKNDT